MQMSGTIFVFPLQAYYEAYTTESEESKFDLFMLKDNMMCYAVISSTIIIFISPQKQSPTTNHCAYVQL